jgi:hypothetical protein
MHQTATSKWTEIGTGLSPAHDCEPKLKLLFPCAAISPARMVSTFNDQSGAIKRLVDLNDQACFLNQAWSSIFLVGLP